MSNIILDSKYPHILDDCLTRLLDGATTLDACLTQYPQYADQLQQDLNIALLANQIQVPEMPTQAVDTLEQRLLRDFNRPRTATRPSAIRQTRIQRMAMPYMRLAAGLAIVFALLLGTGGGTVMASANTLPGDTLYSVKLAWEQVILLLASIVNQSDDVRLHLTRVRASEIEELLAQGRLSNDVLDHFYFTAESAVISVNPDNVDEVIQLMNEIRPAFEDTVLLQTDDARRFRILRILSPQMDDNGLLVLPQDDDLLPVPEETLAPASATPTATITATPTMTGTATQTPTETATPTLTLTRTPTPSRTPTGLPSATATDSPPPLPSATWTPLVLQPADNTTAINSDDDRRIILPTTPTKKPNTSNDNPYFIRQTEASVKLTQTVLAPTATPSS